MIVSGAESRNRHRLHRKKMTWCTVMMKHRLRSSSTSSPAPSLNGLDCKRLSTWPFLGERPACENALKNSWKKPRLARHCSPIGRHRIEHGLLNAQAISQHHGIAGRCKSRGDPRSVDEWESDHLNEYADVIRMAYPAKRPVADDAQRSRIHDLRIPVDSERAHHPPTQQSGQYEKQQRTKRQRSKERAVQQSHFGSRSDQNGRVKRNHPAIPRVIVFPGSATRQVALMAA